MRRFGKRDASGTRCRSRRVSKGWCGMLASVRRHLARAEAVLAVQRANPSEDAALTALYTELGTVVAHTKELVQTRGERDNEARSAFARRKTLRRRLRVGLLRLFAHAGIAAAKGEPA